MLRDLETAHLVTQPVSGRYRMHDLIKLYAAEQAHTYRALSWAWERQGENQQALEHATSALHLYQALDQPVWEAEQLNAVGYYQQALTMYRGLGNTYFEADIWIASGKPTRPSVSTTKRTTSGGKPCGCTKTQHCREDAQRAAKQLDQLAKRQGEQPANLAD